MSTTDGGKPPVYNSSTTGKEASIAEQERDEARFKLNELSTGISKLFPMNAYSPDDPGQNLAIIKSEIARLEANCSKGKTEGIEIATMTKQEIEVLDLLAEAYNKFLKLPEIHSHDKPEFILAIHAAQNIILAREGLRVLDIKGR